jgi:SAM-dependent methyltransferase
VTELGERQRLLRYLAGKGLEVGPGHAPLVTATADLSVRYVDRWDPDENRELFPELGQAEFPRPDLVRDLNRELLSGVPSGSEDFVVASHVLEHLANPMRVLADIYRVLQPGGVLVTLLPDRRLTFDRGRPGTSIDHLVDDFRCQVEEVDDAHLVEFLTHVGLDEGALGGPPVDDGRRSAVLDRHRRRSIHVHCWVLEEFADVICYSIEDLGQAWEFVDGLIPDETDPSSIEFGLVLRRAPAELDPSRLTRRFRQAFDAWLADERSEQALRLELASTRARLEAAEERAISLSVALADRSTALEALRNTRTFRYTRVPRDAYAQLRKLIH